MYDYRKLTPEEKQTIVERRRKRGLPSHAPPHLPHGSGDFLLTAACFEHKKVFSDPQDLTWLEEEVTNDFLAKGMSLHGWVILPNHYHVLLNVPDFDELKEVFRILHSRTATAVNRKHEAKGRKVWYRYSDRQMRNAHHLHASLNYIHQNPVKHRYVDHAQQWPWSSIHDHVSEKGRDWIEDLGRMYPIRDFGKGWDDM